MPHHLRSRFCPTLFGLLLALLPVLPVTAQVLPSQASSDPAADAAISLAQLGPALRQGGYVIYFRHTATDFSRNDANMKGYEDCANQRLLSPAGRTQAQQIGQDIRRLKLPVGEVLASPYCRTLDTATLMMARATPRSELRERQDGDYPGLKQLLASPVPAGSNRWLIGHGIPFRAVAGAPHLAEGEAVVMRPGGTHWTVVARVLPQEWAALR